jgi:hypothetical protein
MPTKVAGVETKRMNLNVPTKLHKQFKISTVIQGKDMTEVLIEFIQQYVDKHYPKDIPNKGRR